MHLRCNCYLITVISLHIIAGLNRNCEMNDVKLRVGADLAMFCFRISPKLEYLRRLCAAVFRDQIDECALCELQQPTLTARTLYKAARMHARCETWRNHSMHKNSSTVITIQVSCCSVSSSCNEDEMWKNRKPQKSIHELETME